MESFNGSAYKPDAPARPAPSDIRVTTVLLDKGAWEVYFNFKFWPDLLDYPPLATVGICHVPAKFADMDGVYEAQCVRTREKLVLLGYLFANGNLLSAEDPHVLFGKGING